VPSWATPAHTGADRGVVITGWIPVALVHLGIRRVEQAVRSGWQLKFSTLPVRVNRRGYQVVLIAADAVTPEMIADERNVCYLTSSSGRR
jgi:hypothetical protein